MLISHEEMLRRINSGKNLVNKLDLPASRPESVRDFEAPKEPTRKNPITITKPGPELKVVIGSLARQGEKVTDIANAFNVSPNAVRSAAEQRGTPTAQKIESTLDRIREMAMDKMLIALGLMTADKFIDAPLKDLSAVAANLSKVIDKAAPRESGSAVHLHLYAPQMRAERDYKVVDI